MITINIDTKSRSIRVQNSDIDWITVKGNHVPVKKGQSKKEAIKDFANKHKKTANQKNMWKTKYTAF